MVNETPTQSPVTCVVELYFTYCLSTHLVGSGQTPMKAMSDLRRQVEPYHALWHDSGLVCPSRPHPPIVWSAGGPYIGIRDWAQGRAVKTDIGLSPQR